MRALSIGHATLVGHSLGGWTAAAFALAHPDMVDRLVLVDASGYATTPDAASARTMEELNPSTREGARRLLAKLYYNQRVFTTDAIVDQVYHAKLAAHDSYTMQRFAVAIAHNRDVLDNRLAAIKKPALIIWGQQDQIVPLSFGQRFNRELTGSRLIVMPYCGHIPQVEMNPWFNAVVLQFLGTQP
jgi:pimeloyl-ACP methyl ester carboxylesterase